MTKWEDGERMSAPQEDYLAGRLDHQVKAALKAKKVRKFITDHPGCGSFDLAKEFGHKSYPSSLEWLLTRGMIRFEQNPARMYYVVPL
jgi:hypothetical protein